MARFVVAGAPCSGKSSYVRERAEAGELIWDYDDVHQALSGLRSHEHLDSIRPFVLAARDAIFSDLDAHSQQPAWIITSTRNWRKIEQLKNRFAAEVVFLDVSREEAHRRCTADARPEAWHGYIDNWFDESDIAGFGQPAKRKGVSAMRRKIFRAPFVLKADGAEGSFSAVFATLNVKDHDGDVTPPGAFEEGQEVIVEPWNHSWNLPVGKGVVHQDEEKAWVEGAFFLDTEVGLSHYKTVKNMGGLQEWSYTFDVLESSEGNFEGDRVRFLRKMDVVGVSPVTRGAGVDTRTTSIKTQKGVVGVHSTETTDAAWDGPASEARLRGEETAAYYRKMYAWLDPEGDPDTKSAYKFPHHAVDGEGNIGEANMRACSAGIGALNGGRGGAAIPEADRAGVHKHLAKHMMDGEMEPPELKTVDEARGDGGKSSRGIGPEVVRAEIEIIEFEAAGFDTPMSTSALNQR